MINQNNSAQSNIFLGPIGIGGTNFTSNLYVAGNCNAAILGNVGIGTTDTTTYKLNVSGSINTTSLNIGGNSLDSILSPYTTSNICKNLILYDTPNVVKKFGFSGTCSTSVVLPDTITYYKFDIDLRNYTKLKNSSGANTPYRIFNITIFISTVYFEAFTTIPNILEYKVFMSNPTTAGSGSGENSGINICALGRPQNYNLNAVLTTNLSLLRTYDFNYLSVVSKNNGTSFNVIIEDLLF